MRKLKIGFVAVAALTLVSGLAIAGYTSFGQVSITSTGANGTMVGARNSSDTVQHIMCNTYAYDTGSEYGSCYARNSAGTTKQCFDANAGQLAVMRSVGPASYISFTIASDGSTCSQVSVTNGSARAQY